MDCTAGIADQGLAALKRFLEKKRLVDHDGETVTQYENLTTEFLDVIRKKFADEIEEADLLRFCDALRKRGREARTVSNYYSAIAAFLNPTACHKKPPDSNLPSNSQTGERRYDQLGGFPPADWVAAGMDAWQLQREALRTTREWLAQPTYEPRRDVR